MIVGELPPFNGKTIAFDALTGELNMYRVDRNNFYASPKPATIYTPDSANEFLFDQLRGTMAREARPGLRR